MDTKLSAIKQFQQELGGAFPTEFADKNGQPAST